MATATNYQLSGNTARTERGLVNEITSTALVQGITATDASWVDQALSATGLPSVGSTITLAGGDRLFLEERNPSIVDGESTKAMVTLIYRRRDGSSSDGVSVPVLTGGTSVKQIETQRDRDGNPIEVSHTWPDDSPATYPDGSPKAGTTETITATISVSVPMSSISGEIVVQTSVPGSITQAYAGHVNETPWQGGDPRTWLCTSATFVLIDNVSSPPLYRLRFDFSYDDQTWDNDTTAAFIDPQTGQVPQITMQPIPNGMEIVRVEYYPTKNFNDDF